MNRCKGCGAEFRKGKRRNLLNADGTLTSAIVCGACAARVLSVLAPLAVASGHAAMAIDYGEIQHLRACLQAGKRRLATYIAAAKRSAAEAYGNNPTEPAGYDDGRVSGLEAGLELLTVIAQGRMP